MTKWEEKQIGKLEKENGKEMQANKHKLDITTYPKHLYQHKMIVYFANKSEGNIFGIVSHVECH